MREYGLRTPPDKKAAIQTTKCSLPARITESQRFAEVLRSFGPADNADLNCDTTSSYTCCSLNYFRVSAQAKSTGSKSASDNKLTSIPCRIARYSEP